MKGDTAQQDLGHLLESPVAWEGTDGLDLKSISKHSKPQRGSHLRFLHTRTLLNYVIPHGCVCVCMCDAQDWLWPTASVKTHPLLRELLFTVLCTFVTSHTNMAAQTEKAEIEIKSQQFWRLSQRTLGERKEYTLDIPPVHHRWHTHTQSQREVKGLWNINFSHRQISCRLPFLWDCWTFIRSQQEVEV